MQEVSVNGPHPFYWSANTALMAIAVVCGKCSATLNVKDSMAGVRGKCPKCGAAIDVPLPHQTDTRPTLALACPAQMVAELLRRGKSSILIHFETPVDGQYKLHEKENWSVQCVGSDDMSLSQVKEVIRSVAKLSEWQEQGATTSPGNPSKEPYELKGDQLGMSLFDFKNKYHREVAGHNEPAPFSSEYRPGQKIDTLFSEPWHADAGIVHCSIEFPFERYKDGRIPTVAGVGVDVLLYKFVDGRLYQISAYFDTRNFDGIQRALIEKYGSPVKEDRKPLRFFWWNGISSINLRRGRISPKEWSNLDYTHHELLDRVTERTPAESDL